MRMTHEGGDDVQIAVAIHVAQGDTSRLRRRSFRAKAGDPFDGLPGGAGLRRLVCEASLTVIQIDRVLSALSGHAVARHNDIQMTIIVHIAQREALGLRPPKHR